MAHDVVNREPVIAALGQLATGPGPALGLMYGRRRVGKTYLLSHVWGDSKAFYYLATQSTPAVNRADLLRDWATWAHEPVEADDYPTWRSVFRLLAAHAARHGRLVVVLDEFQYLLGGPDDAASQLVAVWDREMRDAPITLVLSGSEVATMESLSGAAAPLFGRFSWTHRLRAFDYLDAGRMCPGRSAREMALLFGIFGGTPFYLSQLQESESVADAVKRLVLSPGGTIRLQMETILEQERGLREVAEYRAAMTAIARGQRTRPDITHATGLSDRPHVVRRALDGLSNLGLIRAERDFESPPNAPLRYELADPALAFWHRFVVPNRGPLETGLIDDVWSRRVAPQLDQYMGGVFERMVREGLVRLHRTLELAAPAEVGRWEGLDRSRRSVEIDLLARLLDGSLVAGEVKWSSRPVSVELHHALLRDLEDLARSGRAWAHAVADPTTRFLYVSAAGFEPAFHQLAATDPRIRLLSLDGLYAGR